MRFIHFETPLATMNPHPESVPINALVGSSVALIAVGLPPITPLSGLAALLLTAGAITLKGSLEILVGLTAFWVEDTQPAEWIYSKLVITVGGLFLPLDLFPDWLATIARALPFAAGSCYRQHSCQDRLRCSRFGSGRK